RLGEYRLEGTLERRGERQAFLARDGEVYCVTRGERLDDGVIVDAVGPRRIVLRDAESAVTHTLTLASPPGRDGRDARGGP
ncbi:MAG: hypothetical protein GWO02_03035, partial [Gammaproteobacteria bacterium]|nr:hypothetical protein [Gammaproteobacteria bacterium]